MVLTRTVPHGGYELDRGQFDYLTWTRQLRSFSGLGAIEMQSMNLGGDAHIPERVRGARVTPGSFELLSARPMLGRAVLQEDALPVAPAVVVLGFDPGARGSPRTRP